MSGYINRLRRNTSRIRGGVSSDGARVRGAEDLPLDHQLSFTPEAGEQWKFKDDRWVFLNDVNVEEMVEECGRDIRTLCGLMQGINEYQRHVWTKGGKRAAKFNGIVYALQDKIFRKLNGIYDTITGGLSIECDGSNFWLNNINVRSVINLYRLRPTEKARRYLLNLRDKLSLIMSRRQTSTTHDGIAEQARRLHAEIGAVLEYVPSDAPLCLASGDSGS